MSRTTLNHVLYVFNSHFVRWVLNIDGEMVSNEASLDVRQVEALGVLMNVARSLISVESVQVERVPMLLKPIPEWGGLRRHCGGIPPAMPSADDSLEDALIKLAELAYPLFLLFCGFDEGRASRYHFMSSPHFYGHEAGRAFLSALQKDPLGDLFPSVAADLDGLDYSIPLDSPFFKNLRIQRSGFSSILLRQAWVTTVFRGVWDQGSYQRTVAEVLRKVRAAIQGKPAQTSLFLGFENCSLPVEIECEGVWLRPYRGGQQFGLLPTDVVPSKFGGTNSWVGFVAEVSVDYFLRRSEGESGTMIGARVIEEIAEQWKTDIALALALVQTSVDPLRHHEFQQDVVEVPVAPACVWRYYVELVDQNGLSFSSRYSMAGAVSIEEDVLARVPDMLKRVRLAPDSSIRVAAHRVLMGSQYPRHAEDRILDAIIAWENIAGDTRDAVKMKTCAVVAYLVADSASRGAVRRELEKLYMSRNNIVHGIISRRANDGDLWKDGNRALDVALRALRALFVDGARWIAIRNRFEHMYLGDV